MTSTVLVLDWLLMNITLGSSLPVAAFGTNISFNCPVTTFGSGFAKATLIGTCSVGFSIEGNSYTKVGGRGWTMKGTALLVPPAVLIFTRCVPRALSAGMLNVAVNNVGFETRML